MNMHIFINTFGKWSIESDFCIAYCQWSHAIISNTLLSQTEQAYSLGRRLGPCPRAQTCG